MDNHYKTKISGTLVILLWLHWTCLSQHYGNVASCDTTYSEYLLKKHEVKKTFNRVATNSGFSKATRKSIKEAIRTENYAKLESIIFSILHKTWCTETTSLANKIILLDIPQLNSWVLSQATVNYVRLDFSGIT